MNFFVGARSLSSGLVSDWPAPCHGGRVTLGPGRSDVEGGKENPDSRKREAWDTVPIRVSCIAFKAILQPCLSPFPAREAAFRVQELSNWWRRGGIAPTLLAPFPDILPPLFLPKQEPQLAIVKFKTDATHGGQDFSIGLELPGHFSSCTLHAACCMKKPT